MAEMSEEMKNDRRKLINAVWDMTEELDIPHSVVAQKLGLHYMQFIRYRNGPAVPQKKTILESFISMYDKLSLLVEKKNSGKSAAKDQGAQD